MSGLGAGLAGIDPSCVAELLVTPAQSGPGRRGSGYRVSASAVLTAAHVVRDAALVRVRFDADRPGEWLTEGIVAWSDQATDVAVVTIASRPEDEEQVTPVRFGRVAERDAVLACSAVGYPRFKLRSDPVQPLDDGSPSQYRDSMHAVGTIAVLSNRREGTLEVSVAPPERDPDAERSPWEGMSGAAVWSAGRIIGLVAAHHRADGLGRLAAIRVDRWYEQLTYERFSQLRNLLPVLPALASGLVDVAPATPGELLEAGYTAQVRDIAPETLLGREEELAELVKFCGGTKQYQWLQADAWAGKSALAAWFVLHPPVGVTVVSFFVTGRLAGQADSDAFTEAMIEQLAVVTGEPILAGAVTPAGRDRERRRLLGRAAALVGERGERLLLVVDGLDEDEGARPGSGKPSIASLLPKRPPESVRVLVTSRPHPDVPDDVPGDHPLRRCQRRAVTASPYAQDLEVEAKRELREQLHGDQLQVDLLAFITAAGGGLTLRELGELTAQPEWVLDGTLGSVFGRSLKTRTSTDRSPGDDAERVYLFAHETLRVIAERQLARSLDHYRVRIDAWADDYRAQGWPASTPLYLLRPYGHLLATSGAVDRLVGLATDTARQDRMLADTYADAAALAEINTAQQLLKDEVIPALGTLGCLAVHRDRLNNRNRQVPVNMPALWVHLGQVRRGEALARSIPDPSAQGQALGAIAQVMATNGQWDRAEQTARSISDQDAQARTLISLAQAIAGVDPDRAVALAADAEQTAHSIPNPTQALAAVVEGLAGIGAWKQAEQTARSIPSWYYQHQALAAVVEGLAGVGAWDRAEQIARTISEPNDQVLALISIAKALAEVDSDRAAALAADAERTARHILRPYYQPKAFISLAKAVAGVDPDRAVALAADAEQVVRTEPNPSTQIRALISIAEALAGIGAWDRAEQIARTIPDPSAQVLALISIAKALAEVDSDRAAALAADAEHTVRSIPTFSLLRTRALTAVVEALAGVGAWDRAEQIARSIPEPAPQAEALTAVAQAMATNGQWDRAEQTARTIPNRYYQPRALAAVAKVLVGVDANRAAALATEAELTARSIPDDFGQARTLTAVAEALAGVGAWDLAEETARTIPFPTDQARALTTITKGLAGVGAWDRAEQTARTIPDPKVQAEALTAVTEALAKVDPSRATTLASDAERAARSIGHPSWRALAVTAIAKALANVDPDRATTLATDAEQIARSMPDPSAQVWALTGIAKALANVDPDRATTLATDAEQIARSIPGPGDQARALTSIAEGLAGVGAWDRAEQSARSIPDSSYYRVDQARALTAIAKALANVDPDRATTLATDAEQIARSMPDPSDQARALTAIAEALANVDPDRATTLATDAEQIARSIRDPADQAGVLSFTAKALAGIGAWDRAEQIARSIRSYQRAWALTAVAEALVGIDVWDRAEQTARSFPDPSAQGRFNVQPKGIKLPIDGINSRGSPRLRAGQILAHILAEESWLGSLQVLGKLDPSAVVAVGRALHSQGAPESRMTD